MTPALNVAELVPGHVRGFEAYVPSKPDPELMKLYRVDHLYRLNNNENPLGPPPRAREMIETWPANRASLYPSGDSFYLRQALADRFGLEPDQFLVGNGANEVISFVVHAFCQEGDNIVTADKTFSVYEWVARFSGVEARLAPLVDFGFDYEGLVALADRRTKVLFLCNPNNPTGAWWDQETVCRFLERMSDRLVVLDEAYAEFVDRPGFPDGLGLVKRYPNLVVFRTFSKAYGLAGLRIGYLAGRPEVVDMIRRTCVVYSVNHLAQEAALAAITDETGHIQRTRDLVREEKRFLISELTGLGLGVQHGEGCFIMVKLPLSDTLAYRRLMSEGVMIRSMAGFRFPNWIRVSIGRHEAMEAFMTALRRVLHSS